MPEIRDIIQIDEELCNGCGECVPSCAEGALQIVDGKAKLIADRYCDGLGACLGECPTGALKMIQRKAAPFDEEAVHELLRLREQTAERMKRKEVEQGGGCPSARFQTFTPCQQANLPRANTGSALSHWPVQIRLVPADAPFLKGADLLVAADCAPVAHAGFHSELLKDKAVMLGCPKFDDADAYVQKFVDVFNRSGVKSVTIASMEVPCCSGLPAIVEKAKELSGSDVPLRKVVITTQGQTMGQQAPA